jgi:hypothetical protein
MRTKQRDWNSRATQLCLSYQREPKAGEKLLIEHGNNNHVREQIVRVVRVRVLRSGDLLVKYVDEKLARDPKAEQFNLFFGINCFESSPSIKSWIEE